MQLLFPVPAWVSSLTNKIGLYIHVPFCASKCAYCDFYSIAANEETYETYKAVLLSQLTEAKARLSVFADTLYFGGGTPSLLGGKRIAEIVTAAKENFGLQNAEITVEVNPAEQLYDDFVLMAKSGVNRISVGMQSCLQNELKALSRRHTSIDVIRTVGDAKKAGITNISIDVMLGIPHQTAYTLKQSLDFCLKLGVTHISCYMLKIEPDTAFGKADISSLNLPDEDTVADMYLFMSEYLENNGFEHYEVSNFAKKGFRAIHNLKYWEQKEYLGFGPAAHSYLNGKRFYFDRNLKGYLTSPAPIFDGEGGSREEYVMLKLRLCDGLNFDDYESKFNIPFSQAAIDKVKSFEKMGLICFKPNGFALTTQGFLVSNTIISEIIENL